RALRTATPRMIELFDDFRDILVALHNAGACVVVLGGYAVAFHGHPAREARPARGNGASVLPWRPRRQPSAPLTPSPIGCAWTHRRWKDDPMRPFFVSLTLFVLAQACARVSDGPAAS